MRGACAVLCILYSVLRGARALRVLTAPGCWRPQEVVRRMPRASLTVVPGAGHHLYLDNPAAFHAAVREGLREREGGGG